MNKNYFKNLLYQNKKILLVIFLFGFGICPIVIGVSNHDKYGSFNPSIIPFTIYLVMIFILTYIIPLINYRFIQYKRSVDTFLSLPIKRSTMFNTVTLFSLFEIFVPYLINIVCAIVIIILKGYSIEFSSLFYYLFISSTLMIVLYFINTFIILKCNNSIDSIICMIAYSVLPFAIYAAKLSFLDKYIFGLNTYTFYDFHMCQSVIMMIFSTMEFLEDALMFVESPIDYSMAWYIIYLLLGLIMYIISKKTFIDRKGEDSEQITVSRLMYRLIIPVYTIICISFLSVEDSIRNYIIFIVVIFIIYSIGTFIANREVKITKWSVLMFIITIIITNVSGYIFENTFAKSVSMSFPNDAKSINLYLYSSLENYDLYLDGDVEIKDQDLIKEIQEYQVELVNDHYNNKEYDDYFAHIYISYMNANRENSCSFNYHFSNEKAKEIFEILIKKGYKINKNSYRNGEFQIIDSIEELNECY